MARCNTLRSFGLVTLVATGLCLSGCSQRKTECQTASRDLKFSPVCDLAEEVVDITSADLGVSDSALAQSGGTTLEGEASVGRFPTGLAVVRVEAVTKDDLARRLRVVPVAQYRDAYWNQEMSDLPELREVAMPRKFGLDPRGADWRSVLRVSLAQNCGLCLVYSQVHDTEADAEFVGVLWDTPTEKALATFRVPVQLPPEIRETYQKKKQWIALQSDAEFRAETELRRLVRDTLWDFAAKDADATTTQPNPWQTDLPLFPRDYRRHLQIYINERQPQ